MDRAAVVERLGPATGAVHQLVGQNHAARPEVRPQRADGTRSEHLTDPDLCQRPQIGPVGHVVRREPVVAPVPGDERHLASADLADDQRVGRGAVGGVDLQLDHVVEERVETAAADDADVGGWGGVGHAGNAIGVPPPLAAGPAICGWTVRTSQPA
jgi:hypothetical protein